MGWNVVYVVIRRCGGQKRYGRCLGGPSGSWFLLAILVFLAEVTDPPLGTHSGPLAKDAALVGSQNGTESELFVLLSVLADAEAFFLGVFVLWGAFYLANEFCPQSLGAQLVAPTAFGAAGFRCLCGCRRSRCH